MREGSRLDQLHRHRRRLAAADAQRGDAALAALLLERVHESDENSRATSADRVAVRDANDPAKYSWDIVLLG
jgi:hypothetical protein